MEGNPHSFTVQIYKVILYDQVTVPADAETGTEKREIVAIPFDRISGGLILLFVVDFQMYFARPTPK